MPMRKRTTPQAGDWAERGNRRQNCINSDTGIDSQPARVYRCGRLAHHLWPQPMAWDRGECRCGSEVCGGYARISSLIAFQIGNEPDMDHDPGIEGAVDVRPLLGQVDAPTAMPCWQVSARARSSALSPDIAKDELMGDENGGEEAGARLPLRALLCRGPAGRSAHDARVSAASRPQPWHGGVRDGGRSG